MRTITIESSNGARKALFSTVGHLADLHQIAAVDKQGFDNLNWSGTDAKYRRRELRAIEWKYGR